MLEKSSRVILVIDDGLEPSVVMTTGDSGTVKFFGGRLKPGESSIQGAIRETCVEEAGISIEQKRFVYLGHQIDEKSDADYYLVKITSDEYAKVESFVDTSQNPENDVRSVFKAAIYEVEEKLTHQPWKVFWRKNLKRSLEDNLREGNGVEKKY